MIISNIISTENIDIKVADLYESIGLDINTFHAENERVLLDKFASLLLFCRLRFDSLDFFYYLGNNISRTHHQTVGSLIEFLSKKEKTNNQIPNKVKNYCNLAEVSFINNGGQFHVDIKLHPDIETNYKNIFNQLKQLIYGYISRILELIFDWKSEDISLVKPKNLERKSQLELKLVYPNPPIRNKIAETVDLKSVLYNKLVVLNQQSEEQSIIVETREFLNRDICFSIEEIAENLNTSPRSMQRKLKTFGTSFSKIKEEIRKEMVEQLLQDKYLSIAEITDLLGYSERSAFERAFKKWFAINPSQWRKNCLKD